MDLSTGKAGERPEKQDTRDHVILSALGLFLVIVILAFRREHQTRAGSMGISVTDIFLLNWIHIFKQICHLIGTYPISFNET